MKTKNIGKGFGNKFFVRGLVFCLVIFGLIGVANAQPPITYQCNSCVSCTTCLTGGDCNPVAPGVQAIAPGDTLILVANIGPGAAPPIPLNAFGNCINWNVAGNGAIFVCNGTSIIGAGAGDGVHVTGGCPSAQIRSCEIRNFEHGILLDGTNSFTIWQNNNIHDNGLHGILFVDSNNNLIDNSQIHDNGVDGIRLEDSNKNDIMRNTIQRNGDDGINLWSSGPNNEILDNTINNNGADGIKLKESNDNRIERNEVLENERHGMYLITSNSNTIRDNPAININGVDGIKLAHSNDNKILGDPMNLWTSIINDNGRHGVHFFRSIDNTIDWNRITGNGGYGVFSHPRFLPPPPPPPPPAANCGQIHIPFSNFLAFNMGCGLAAAGAVPWQDPHLVVPGDPAALQWCVGTRLTQDPPIKVPGLTPPGLFILVVILLFLLVQFTIRKKR